MFLRLSKLPVSVAIVIFCLIGLAMAVERPSLLLPNQNLGKWLTVPAQSNPKPEPLRSMVSAKNLLGLDRDTPFGLPREKWGGPLAQSSQTDTIRVLALKIEFQTESPDDPTTTGNGNFDLRTYDQFVQEEGHYFDPAPHNTAYFSAHMQALARYYFFVSDRNLRIIWEVYPQQETIAIRLPHPMSYYGSGGIQDSIIPGMTKYFEESIIMADSLYPQLDFSRYGSIFLFHAGSDQQNNFAFIIDTPNDLWTGFIMVEDSVVVDSGRNSVREGLIMPETACQDNRITCLNAVIAHEFGHQLGLPDIYNSGNFMTQVGNFSLMDNNGMSVALDFGGNMRFVTGTMPVYPDAWSRAYLGFSAVTEITDGQNVKIKAAEQLYHANEIIKIPISDYEYFLLENRQIEADFSYLNYFPRIQNALLADPVTGVILGPGYAYFENGSLDTIKVPTAEYDRLLPGSGMLIWHVDEAVAYLDYSGQGANNFLLNTLQWDPARRFLSLVEADGIIDFGGNYMTGYGTDAEYYKAGNNTSLTPTSRPNSHSNLGADSHISITGIGATDTIMNCARISIDWHRPGFPAMGIPDLGYNGGGLFAFDAAGDGHKGILAASGRYLVAMNDDGSSFIQNHFGLLLPRFDGDSLIYDFPIFARLDSNIVGRLVAGNFYGGDSLEIACADQSNKLYIFMAQDQSPLDSLADLLAVTQMPAAVISGPVAYDIDDNGHDEIVVGLADSTIRMFRIIAADSVELVLTDSLPGLPLRIALADSMIFILSQGSSDIQLNIGHFNHVDTSISAWSHIPLSVTQISGMAVGDVNRDSIPDVIITAADKLLIYDGKTNNVTSTRIENSGPLALGDIDSDGRPEIVFVGGQEFFKIYACNGLGISLNGFPLKLNHRLTMPARFVEPILTDLDEDGNPDIVLSLPKGGLDAYNHLGERLSGFPLASSTPVLAPPCVSDIDADGKLELLGIDSSGFVAAWNLGVADSSINAPWPMAFGGLAGNAYLSPLFDKDIVTAPGFLTERSVYNYPNPASNRTAFRYYVDRQAQILIKIYDMTGEKIDELAGSSVGGSESEISWDCSKFASGVYFARFEAKAADISKSVLVKVALIK
jgi:M6 family metalloprotease-like protein